ncbi:MAG TPA: ATP-binding cassette domain-containing protein [Candidatus Saccharimonadia bacterium]|jgi:ABC-2 type transport system ATP-binding protein|nr:ATP-binding cassette domain-containing protein [Candidatus Saccharimonadia bacterium]
MAEPMVSIQNFRMRFGDNVVIDDLSFDVHQGETFAFLGSNGSGKTTTIRTLLGIFEPTAGKLLIKGQPYTPKLSPMLGYLPEERGLYKKESVLATMLYFGELKRMDRASARQWCLEYLERVGLGDKAATPIEKLSGGQQQKIQLGVTIMNNPELMILDEPTKGFDPVNRRLLMDIIEEHSRQGATVILVTHQMEEVERLCDRVILLKDGRRRLYGTVEEIRGQYGEEVIELEYDGPLPRSAKSFRVNQAGKRAAELSLVEGATAQAVLHELMTHKQLLISKFELRRSSLDDIFVEIYNEGLGAEGKK